jgi:hypothetical protein
MENTSLSKQTDRMQIAIMLASCFAFFCYFYQLQNPPCCDAASYVQIAKTYAVSGISQSGNALDSLRLYGYPLFLSLIVKIAAILGLQFTFVLFAVQVSFFFLATYLLSQIITKNFSPLVGKVVFYSLLANILIYPNLATSLTDGVTVVLLILIAYTILKILISIVFDSRPVQIGGWGALLGYFVGFAIMVRPASIYLLLMLVVVICFFIWLEKSNTLSLGLLLVLAVAVGFMFAVTPQVVYNFSSFHVFSFMPVTDLGALQFDVGTHSLKYLTNLAGGNPELCYESPWSQGAHGEGLVWYFKNPLIGFKTVFMHLYGALDHDYLFTYVYNLNIWYRPILFIFSQFVLFWGVVGYFYAANDLRKFDSPDKNEKSKVLHILFSLTFVSFMVGWASIHAFARNEVRFSLPVIAVLLPLAAWVVFVRLRTLSQNKLIYGIFVMYLLLAATLSSFLGGLKQICP